MTTVTTPNSQHRIIQVYFLAAPEDQDVCEVIYKYLKPIIRSSKVPIEVNSDFNIPSGADTEKYKERLFEADIVLALISSDFISNDDTYNRNQKVSERHNNREAVIIPILVRNCMWRSTPFVHMNILPKSEQPLNNKKYWDSPDDAVTAVVEDIYTSIYQLIAAYAQNETRQPLPVAEIESAPDLNASVETPISQVEPAHAITELAPAQSEAVQPAALAEVEAIPDLTAPVEASIPQMEPDKLITELPQAQSEAVQSMPAAEVESAPVLAVTPLEASVPQMEPESSMPELPPVQSQAVQPAVASVPVLTPVSVAAVSQTTSQAKASSTIAADWRKKYYQAVLLKRAGAILLDQAIIIFVPLFLLFIVAPGISDVGANWFLVFLYFVVAPLMEASKWQGTIGKRILKLQITDKEGDRITFLRAFWRNIMRTLVLYSYGLIIPLVIQYFRFNKTKKMFHDELSGTEIGERLPSSAAAPVAVHAT